jgi:hypothetical protein
MLLIRIFLLLWLESAAADTTSPTVRSGGTRSTTAQRSTRALVVPRRPPKAACVARDLRGGGGSASSTGAVFGTPISKENLAWLLMGECFFNGIIGIAAPETLAETFSLPNVREGSLAHLSFEFVGAGLFSIAMALYLARFTRRPAHDIVAFSSLPSAFVVFRHFLKGTPSRIGYRRGVWELFLAYYVIGIEMILSKKGDTVLVSKIFASIPAIIGLNGMLDRSFAKAIWGINIADGQFFQFILAKTSIYTEFCSHYLVLLCWVQVLPKQRIGGCPGTYCLHRDHWHASYGSGIL